MQSHKNTFLIALLLLLAGLGYHFDADRWLYRELTAIWRHGLGGDPRTGNVAAPEPAGPALAISPYRTHAESTRDYRLAHEPGADPRVLEGAARAVREYARLFARQKSSAYVRISVEPVDAATRVAIFTVGVDLDERRYRVLYATAADAMNENLRALGAMLADFQADFAERVVPVADVRRRQTVGAEPRGLLLADPLNRLVEIDRALRATELDSRLFDQAAEAYAMLAWYKSWHLDDALADSLAANAVANYLLGTLFAGDAHDNRAYYAGMILLALQHEADALAAFGQADAKHSDAGLLWSAYLRADIDAQQALAGSDPRVAYLLARTHARLQQTEIAERLLMDAWERNPGDLEISQYLAHVASLGVARTVLPAILYATLAQHGELATSLLTSRPQTWQADIEQPWPDSPRSLTDLVRGLARSHGVLTGNVASTRPGDRLLDGDTLRHYLTQDFLNACLLVYDVYARNLSVYENARAVQQAVSEVYPDSDTARVLRLWIASWTGDAEAQRDYAQSLDPRTAGTFLLREMLKTFGAWDHWKVWPFAAAALAEYHDRESTGSTGSKRLGIVYAHSLHRAIGADYLQRARVLDPYDHSIYSLLATTLDDESHLTQGEKLLGEQYPYLLARAERTLVAGDVDAAIALYQRVTRKAPTTYAGYAGLVRAYRRAGKADEAMAACRRYLEQDRQTLAAVDIQNTLGDLLLERGQTRAALAVFAENKASMQAGALVGYARANEKLGQLDEARRYYALAAERYPQGWVTPAYAVFLLRHNERDAAVAVLRNGLENNRGNYYFDALIDFHRDPDRLPQVLELVNAVHDGRPEPLQLYDLADRLSKIGAHRLAADLHWSLVERGFDPWLHGALYMAETRSASGDAEAARDRAFAALGTDVRQQAWFANHFLHGEGYRDAFAVYPGVGYTDPWDKADKALLMTLAWKAGGLGAGELEKIDLAALNIHPWRRLLADYLLDKTDEATVLASVDDGGSYTTAHFYIGIRRLLDGRGQDAADHFRIALANGSQEPTEYYLAYRELAKLEGKTRSFCCNLHWD